MAIIVWCTSGLSLCGGVHMACHCVVVHICPSLCGVHLSFHCVVVYIWPVFVWWCTSAHHCVVYIWPVILWWCTSGLSLCGGTHLACYCVVVYMSHVIVWQCTSGLPVFGCVYLACCEMVCIRPVTAQWYTGSMLLYDSVQVVCYVWWCTGIRCHCLVLCRWCLCGAVCM